MWQLEGFDDESGCICQLIRPLYQLKQSRNVWNEEFTSQMKSVGFTQLKTDYCYFIQREEESFSVMIIWVDNILSFSTTDARNNWIEADLKSKFEVNTIGNPSMILGIKLMQELNKIMLSQMHYINLLLKKFGLEEANPVTTPLDPNINLDNPEGKEELESINDKASNSYAMLIRSLMYLVLGTQPNIAYAINRLAQFTKVPKPKHWTAVKQIF